ncbi:Envelope fusion protein [Anthophora quadrimaculata]
MKNTILVMMLAMTTTVEAQNSTIYEGFQLRTLSEKNTIFLENLGDVYVYHETWRLAITIEFQRIEADLKELHKGMSRLLLDCNIKFKPQSCIVENRIKYQLNGKHGIANPLLLNPTKIMTTLSQLTEHQNFPIKLTEPNFSTLIDISHLTIALIKNKLIYIMQIPIIENQNYKLKRIIPIPTYSYIKGYITQSMEMDYIIINNKQTKYIPLNIEDFIQLKPINNKYIMKRKQPDYRIDKNEYCVLQILIHKNINCEPKYINIQNTLYYPLATENQWLIVPIKEKNLDIACKNKDPTNIEIKLPTILTLNKTCTALNKEITLTPSIITKNITIETYNTKTHDESTILQLIKTYNLSTDNIEIQKLTSTTLTNEQVEKLGTSINTINDQIQQLAIKKRNLTWTETAYQVGKNLCYLTALLVLLYIAHKCGLLKALMQTIKFCFTPCKNCYIFDHCTFGQQSHTLDTIHYNPPNTVYINPIQEAVTINDVPDNLSETSAESRPNQKVNKRTIKYY